MFERFTTAARRIVVLAQEEARMLNHNYIGTEHLLLAVLNDETSASTEILLRHGAAREDVLSHVKEMIGLGQVGPTGHIPFTPRAKKALERSVQEALGMEPPVVDAHHILLGVLRGEGACVAVKALALLSVEADAVIEDLTAHLASETGNEGDPVDEALAAFRKSLGGIPLDAPYSALKLAMAEALLAGELARLGFTRAG